MGNERRRKSKHHGRSKKRRTEEINRLERATEIEQRTQSVATSLEEQITAIPSMDLPMLSSVIDEARLEQNVTLQTDVVRACLQRILDHSNLGRQPREEQVRTLRRLIFGKGDTLLIARTGFGKSLIFHAFSILTGLITLQIIPLSKLGDEQLDDIRRLDGSKPCLITSRSKREQKDLLQQVTQGSFTHVLLGPEQAASKIFRNALKDIALQRRIGLVAIDECHLIKQWKDFRPEFTMIGQLRMILPPDVVWFGCSATLDDEAERQVLTQGGFRSLGPRMYQTVVIRTSIDRSDVSICVLPIPRGGIRTFDALFFLLDRSVDVEGTATPEQIPKVIVFIDGRTTIAEAVECLQCLLVGRSTGSGPRYTTDTTDGPYCVYNVVELYTAHVAEHDRDSRYTEFRKPTSTIRIIIATTSLGMGINVEDVECVCLWGFPIGCDLGDFWQRLGRGGRGEGRFSKGYIFLPYWAFDSEGTSKRADYQIEKQVVPSVAARKTYRNRLPISRAKAKACSQLRQYRTPGDISDIESVTSQSSSLGDPQDESQGDSQGNSQGDSRGDSQGDSQGNPQGNPQGDSQGDGKKVRYWTKTEQKRRDGLGDKWKEMINGTCHRRAFLAYLGEYKITTTPTPKEQCCARCNPSLLPHLSKAPVKPQVIQAPKATSRAGVALSILEEWTTKQADLEYHSVDRRFPLPPSAFMDTTCRWQLAYLYITDDVDWAGVSMEKLGEMVPCILDWAKKEAYGLLLIERLQEIAPLVTSTYSDLVNQRKNAKKAEQQPLQASGTRSSLIQRDDTLAIQVARREAGRRAARVTIQQPASLISSSQITNWVTNAINMPSGVAASPLMSAPSGVPEEILAAMGRLEDARSLSRSASIDMSVHLPSPHDQVSKKRARRRETGAKRRPLAEIYIDVRRSVRQRRLTMKAAEIER